MLFGTRRWGRSVAHPERNYYFTHTQENLDKQLATPKGKNLQIPLRAAPMLKKQNNNLRKKHVIINIFIDSCYAQVMRNVRTGTLLSLVYVPIVRMYMTCIRVSHSIVVFKGSN